MSKLEGVVERSDFGGAWHLVTSDGTRYALDPGRDRGLLEEGKKVVVEGTIVDDSVGIGMDTTQGVKVRSWKERA